MRAPALRLGLFLAIAFAIAARPVRAQAAALLDTTALLGALRALPPIDDPRPLARAFVVGVQQGGSPLRPSALAAFELPETTRDTLVQLLDRFRRPESAALPGFRTQVVLQTGPEASITETRLAETAVEVLDPRSLQRSLQDLADRIANGAEGTAEVRLRVRLVISAEGLVESANVLESSGRPTVDAEALRLVQRARFRPRTIEGIAVRAVATLPLRFMVED